MATTYKVLGQAAPANTSNADLYTVPSATQAVVSTLHVANTTAADATFSIYVRIAGAAAANSNAIAKDVTLAANSLFSATQGITLAATDVITIQSGTADALTFSMFGSEVA
jgi:uncharacterized protein (UPF0303 family)